MSLLKIWFLVLGCLVVLVGLGVLVFYLVSGLLWLVVHDNPLVNAVGWLLLVATCITALFPTSH